MTDDSTRMLPTRRTLLKSAAGLAALGVTSDFPKPAIAQGAPLKIGFMLPYTGTYAKLGKFIDEGFRLKVDQLGGKLGGRALEYVQVDDESEPAKATDNMNRLVGREKVDVVVGTVHSGVAMAMAKVARETNTLLIVPNAGANEVTGPMCARNIWRTSFTNWQPCFPMGKVMYDAGHRNVMTITWRYAAGEQDVEAFKEGFGKLGGKVVEELYLPFPQVEFQPLITQIAAKKPDAVFSFFAGGGAVKFVKDYAAAGLKTAIPLYGVGFLTDGTLQAQGDAAEGLKTTLHYADDLDNPANKAFLAAFKARTGQDGDVYAVQGFDSAALLQIGLAAAGGDIHARDKMYAAMAAAKIDSPRGPISFSKANNVVQNIYLREVRGGLNRFVSVAHANLADPARGCRMAV
jgi:branched-chain amino acid transport system substrate-binding protein